MVPQALNSFPTADEVQRAVAIFLARAFSGDAPASAEEFCPPADADMSQWLMSDIAERTPDACAPLDEVRSFALRIGNEIYPNMKLRISRTPNGGEWVFHVDAHDAMLRAPAGSPDAAALEDLKAHNAAITRAIHADWEAAGLLTERRYLRNAIDATRPED